MKDEMMTNPNPTTLTHWMTALTNALEKAHSALEYQTIQMALDYFGRDMREAFLNDDSRWCDYFYDYMTINEEDASFESWDFDLALNMWCAEQPYELARWAEQCFED